MTQEWIALLAAIAGGIITAFGKFMKTHLTSDANDVMDFRKRILERQTKMEARIDKLDEKIQMWTVRYWALYSWCIQFCIENNINTMPPRFDEMDRSEIKEMSEKDSMQDLRDYVKNRKKE